MGYRSNKSFPKTVLWFVGILLVVSGCSSSTIESNSTIEQLDFSQSLDNTVELERAETDYHLLQFGSEAFPIDRGQYWESPYWYEAEAVGAVIPLVNGADGYRTNEDGVLIVDWPGFDEPIYHPVEMTLYGLYSLVAFQHTGSQAYLQRAEANARALVEGGIIVDGALWFPYPFDHALQGDEAMTLESPWYSGMAQGQALDLLSKLCAITNEDYWCEQADSVFASFQQRDLPDQSFVRIDKDGYLWLEEYVGTENPTEVINGHIYSAFGLAEYYRATGNTEALQMFSGASATVLDYFENYRVVDGISYYCNAQYCKDTEWQPENYHRGVARQFRHLAYITDNPRFVEMQELFSKDHKQWRDRQETD